MIPLTHLVPAQSPDPLLSDRSEMADAGEPRAPLVRKKVHRSRAAYGIFTLLAFLVTVVATSVVESAVVGYVLWAMFQAGDFNVSTCVKFHTGKKHSELMGSVFILLLLIQVDTARLGTYHYNLGRT
jgi:hypothetical protein